MKCRALKDGLIDDTTYIHAGETFSADVCPSWAAPVEPENKPALSGKKEKGK